MGTFESRLEDNVCLKAGVLKRNESIVATTDPSFGLFAKGLAKGKLWGIVDVQ